MDTKDYVILAVSTGVTLLLGLWNFVQGYRATRKASFINTVTSQRVLWIEHLRQNVARFIGLTHHWTASKLEGNRALLKRFAREEDEHEIARTKDELWRRAYERSQELQSAATLIEVGIPLQGEVERRAAWALFKEGRATLRGNECFVAVDKMPAVIRQAMAARNNYGGQ